MKLFNGAELRLTRDDLITLLTEGINKELMSAVSIGTQRIVNLTLHPDNKYVIRITLQNKLVKEQSHD